MMRTLVCTMSLALGVVPCAAGAQGATPFHTNEWAIAGSAALQHTHDDLVGESTSISVSPSGLMFLTPHVAAGAAVSLFYSKSGPSHTTGFGVGPGLRYYFADSPMTLIPYVSASVMPNWQWIHRPFVISGQSTDTGLHLRATEFEGAFGMIHLLSPHVGISGEVYYRHLDESQTQFSVDQSHTSYDYGVRFGLSVFAK